jgi:hypothetical protein
MIMYERGKKNLLTMTGDTSLLQKAGHKKNTRDQNATPQRSGLS